jgi:hypothetical protein
MLVGRRNASSTVNFAYLIFGKESFDASNYITARAEIVFAPSYDGIDECPCTVQGIGDMNGDGLDDFAIGVSRSDANGDASGRIYIFYGRPSRADWGFVDNEEETTAQVQVPLDTADMMINGETAQDQAGLALAAGDLNNDGWQDLIVSAPYYDYAPSATENVGRVYVIFGYPPVRNPRPAN